MVLMGKKFNYLMTGEMPCIRPERRCVDEEELAVYEMVRLEYPEMIDPEYEACWDVCLERESVPEGWVTLEDTSTPLLSAIVAKEEKGNG
jgi:hypothetical protein